MLRDALLLVTKYGHMATHGHGRNHPGESQRDRATPLWNICPITLPVDAGSHRHVHLIDAGIHVKDETVHAPAGLCADKNCETIPLLKWRLDRYVLKTERRAGNGGHRGPHHAMFRRGWYDSLYHQSPPPHPSRR